MEAFNQRPRYCFSPAALRLFHEAHRRTAHAQRHSLGQSISDLSHLFTKGRSQIAARYLDNPELLAAYAGYFFPVNFAKVQLLLDELPEDWASKASLSVFDVGAGLGTASLAVLDWLTGNRSSGEAALHVTALDHSKSALKEAAHLWAAYQQDVRLKQPELRLAVERIEKLATADGGRMLAGGGPFDLIIVANCLNELFQESADPAAQRATLLERLLAVLQPDGTLLVLEPALRSTARALHEARDLLLARGVCTVYSPCLHESPCPALVKEDDWCHEERAWQPPEWLTDLDRQVGFIKDALKFSYLVLRKDGRTIVPRSPNTYRVVSELRSFKGEKRAWLCNESGRSEVGRLDRKATSGNAAVDAWHRGAIVQIDHVVRKERGGRLSDLGRIGEDSAVKVVRNA